MKARIIGGEFDGVEFEVSIETQGKIEEKITKWEHGDIALSHWITDEPRLRLILIRGVDIEIRDNNGTYLYGGISQEYIRKQMREHKYERIGNLFKDSGLIVKTLKEN